MTRRGTRLRVLFAVQGEGRGYRTQALALAAMLRRRGHTVVGALVGTDRWGDVPDQFRRGLGAPAEAVESPGAVSGARGQVRPAATLLRALGRGSRISRGLDQITAALDRTEPDVVVNVYQGLMGAHALLRGLDVPTAAVGHPFMAAHPDYPQVPGQPAQRIAARAYTALAGAGAAERLALSLYDTPAASASAARVTPPLVRDSLFSLADRPRDGSAVVSLTEPRLAPALAAWSDRHPDVRLHAFAPVAARDYSAALTFHGLDGRAFRERVAAARAVVCAADFETVSEAMWLGTPALMVPTPGHYEQRGTAAHAVAAGAGLTSDALDLDLLLDVLATPPPDPGPFRQWVARAEGRAVGAIERAAGLAPASGDGLAEAADVQVDVSVPSRPAVD